MIGGELVPPRTTIALSGNTKSLISSLFIYYLLAGFGIGGFNRPLAVSVSKPVRVA